MTRANDRSVYATPDFMPSTMPTHVEEPPTLQVEWELANAVT